MDLRKEIQIDEIQDEILAITSIIRPVLIGTLYSLKHDIVSKVGGYEKVTLDLLPRLRREGDGDCGICFEYAVHDAVRGGDQRVQDRLSEALKLCKVRGSELNSILFGIEKSGALQLIDTANSVLTDDSRVLAGNVGQPAKLKRHIAKIAGAFRNRRTRLALPNSIRGLWKADLFVGTDEDRWVGTTVKLNPKQLEGAAGLRVGIVPVRQGQTDKVRLDEDKNLVICPIHHDFDFMQCFYEAWRIVQAFLDADAKMPREVDLPVVTHREVCRILVERRKYPVLDVVDAIEKFGQRKLIDHQSKTIGKTDLRGSTDTDMVVAPVSLTT